MSEALLEVENVAAAPWCGPAGRTSRNRTLYPSRVTERLSGLRAGGRLASRIEEDLLQRCWPGGLMYGSEAALCERFQVGRAVVREAVRVLETRGCARMRRGPSGGLQVLRPGRTQCAEMAASYLQLLDVSATQIDDAQRMLGRVKACFDRSGKCRNLHLQAEVLAHINNTALPFFEELIETFKRFSYENLDVQASTKTAPLSHHSRAGQIARQLMAEYTPQEWASGIRLGSISDLCERYRIYRDGGRQAIRILESAGVVVSLTGRGNGVFSQAPLPTSICRLINCHFAAHGFSNTAAVEFYRAMSVEAIAKAAPLATAADVCCINAALDKAAWALEGACEDELARALYEAEECQFSILNNPLIDLFLRSTSMFPAWDVCGVDESALCHQVYLAETRKVAVAIAGRVASVAARAQQLKNQRLAGMVAAAFAMPRVERRSEQ